MKSTAKNWRNGERNWDQEKRHWKKNLPENCKSRKFSLKWLENLNALTLQHKAGFPNSIQSPAFTPLGRNSGNCCRFFIFGVLHPHCLTWSNLWSTSKDLALFVFGGDNQCHDHSFFFYYFEWKKREKELVYNGNVMSFRCFKNVFFYLSLKKYVIYGFDFK